MAKKTQF